MDWTEENLRRIRAYDEDWDESKHPRADNGQFSSGGGGASTGASASVGSAPKAKARMATKKTPEQKLEGLRAKIEKATKKNDYATVEKLKNAYIDEYKKQHPNIGKNGFWYESKWDSPVWDKVVKTKKEHDKLNGWVHNVTQNMRNFPEEYTGERGKSLTKLLNERKKEMDKLWSEYKKLNAEHEKTKKLKISMW